MTDRRRPAFGSFQSRGKEGVAKMSRGMPSPMDDLPRQKNTNATAAFHFQGGKTRRSHPWMIHSQPRFLQNSGVGIVKDSCRGTSRSHSVELLWTSDGSTSGKSNQTPQFAIGVIFGKLGLVKREQGKNSLKRSPGPASDSKSKSGPRPSRESRCCSCKNRKYSRALPTPLTRPTTDSFGGHPRNTDRRAVR